MSRSFPELVESYQGVLGRVGVAARGCGRDPSAITLIAVSKKQPIEKIEALYRLGHRDFGENYVQELLEKAPALEARGCSGIRWHFIGHLQTNKVKALVPYVYSVHSVDSERVAQALAKVAGGRSSPLSVFIEVNAAGESSKSGIAPDGVPALARRVAVLPGLSLQGLMCVPPSDESEERLRARFRELRELELKCRPASLGRLSMGMSADFEAAIREGATEIRVGTLLFGARS